VSFAEACFVFAVNERDVSKLRHGITQRLIYEDLTGRVINVVITSDNMGNPHKGIVDDYCEIIGGSVISPENDKVIQFFTIKGNLSPDQVIKAHLPLTGS
jgi:hypothetical protein